MPASLKGKPFLLLGEVHQEPKTYKTIIVSPPGEYLFSYAGLWTSMLTEGKCWKVCNAPKSQAPSCSFLAGKRWPSSMPQVSILQFILPSLPERSRNRKKMSRESYVCLGPQDSINIDAELHLLTISFQKKKNPRLDSSTVFNHLASHWQLCKQACCVGLGSDRWSTPPWQRAGKQTEANSALANRGTTDRVALCTAALDTCSEHLQT